MHSASLPNISLLHNHPHHLLSIRAPASIRGSYLPNIFAIPDGKPPIPLPPPACICFIMFWSPFIPPANHLNLVLRVIMNNVFKLLAISILNVKSSISFILVCKSVGDLHYIQQPLLEVVDVIDFMSSKTSPIFLSWILVTK